MLAPNQLLPGTEVRARGLRWEVVGTESLGLQTLYRLRGLENAILGQEFDLLSPFEEIQPVHLSKQDRNIALHAYRHAHCARTVRRALVLVLLDRG